MGEGLAGFSEGWNGDEAKRRAVYVMFEISRCEAASGEEGNRRCSQSAGFAKEQATSMGIVWQMVRGIITSALDPRNRKRFASVFRPNKVLFSKISDQATRSQRPIPEGGIGGAALAR